MKKTRINDEWVGVEIDNCIFYEKYSEEKDRLLKEYEEVVRKADFEMITKEFSTLCSKLPRKRKKQFKKLLNNRERYGE